MKFLTRYFLLIATLLLAYSCNPEEAEAIIDFLGGDVEYTVPAEGGSVELEFQCDKDWYSSIILPLTELENDWYAVEGMHGDAGTGYVKVTLQENPRDAVRTMEVQITAGSTKSAKIKITQLAAESGDPGNDPGNDPVNDDSEHIDSKVKVAAYDITSKSVYFKGTFDCEAPAGYESRNPVKGFMISDQYKTVEDIYEYGTWIDKLKYQTTGDSANVCRAYFSNLKPGTTYCLIACAEYENAKSYKTSKIYTFSSAVVKSDYNGYEYVDLGLSVKWAKYNLGADNEYSVGNYYCWGETSTKETYWTSNYKYYAGKGNNGGVLFSKYVSMQGSGKDGMIDNIMCLEPADDAAHANMGGTWRLPHDSELQELIDKCTWEREYEMVGETKHYTAVKVTGPNENYIILPFGGNKSGESVLFENQGRYMGAELVKASNNNCCELDFTTGNYKPTLVQGGREGGLSIRAVTE